MKNNPFCITDGRKTNSSHRLFYQAMARVLKFEVCDGEKAGHLELKKKLDRLAAGGKRVFVLTATHDIL